MRTVMKTDQDERSKRSIMKKASRRTNTKMHHIEASRGKQHIDASRGKQHEERSRRSIWRTIKNYQMRTSLPQRQTDNQNHRTDYNGNDDKQTKTNSQQNPIARKNGWNNNKSIRTDRKPSSSSSSFVPCARKASFIPSGNSCLANIASSSVLVKAMLINW